MARKMNALRTSPAGRESAVECHRQSLPATAAACLAQIRDYAQKLRPPKARLQIAIQIEEPSEAPRVIKIIHTDPF
jgi:hypothetical protein